MKATRSDVAKLAGVSNGTVSNVMNNPELVKPQTVERVLDAMKKLNYKPNMIARSLSTNRTMQIGIALENISNPFYGQIVEQFEEEANKYGYFVNICMGTNKLDNYLDNFVSRAIDGVFLMALPYKFSSQKFEKLLESNISLLISGNATFHHPEVCSIEHDYRKAMSQAIDHLVSLGHKKIVYLSGLGKELAHDIRFGAYTSHMLELGLAPSYVEGEYPYNTNSEAGYTLAKKVLDSGKEFTALICGNDIMAIGAIRALHESGLRVPEDVSVMGFDGITLDRFSTPSITTMAVDAKAFGKNAFQLLYNNMMKGEVSSFSSELKLVKNESTDICRSEK